MATLEKFLSPKPIIKKQKRFVLQIEIDEPQKMAAKLFGVWKHKNIDGLEFQKQIRKAEW